MSISDERLKQRVNRVIDLQRQNLFVVDTRHELPLPDHKSLTELHYGNTRDETGRFYDMENSWGKFNYDPESYRSLLILRRGTPPPELVPQPRLELVTATVHAGYVTINNNGSSFDLDLQTRDQVDFSTLRTINQTLASEQIPVVVWQADETEDETPPIIRITNESAMLFATSAIWDTQNQQLVATQVVTTSQELLKAIKATLANNNTKSYLTLKTPDDNAYLKGARRGFTTVGNNLAQANAEGTVTALVHPLAGDPQANAADHFYIVIAHGETISQKFAERLDLAIPWPIQPAWADYLLEAGQEVGLVEVLPSCGDDFTAGLRISKNETEWQQLISAGLKAGRISIA